MRVCSLDGCEAPHVAKGFCQNHYRVFMRRGAPVAPTRPGPGVHVATGGYLFRSIDGRTVYEHVAIAERALGKPLPPGAEVHHCNGDPADNRPGNLVICPDHAYHMLLHQRERALIACGHADWRPCKVCGTHDDPARMRPHLRQFYHPSCIKEQSRIRRAQSK